MTDPARWNEIATLFDELIEQSPDARERRLAEIARSDPQLSSEVRALLDADEDGNALLDAGAPSAVPNLLDEGAPADRRAGPYRLLRKLGEGGMQDDCRRWCGARIEVAVHDRALDQYRRATAGGDHVEIEE